MVMGKMECGIMMSLPYTALRNKGIQPLPSLIFPPLLAFLLPCRIENRGRHKRIHPEGALEPYPISRICHPKHRPPDSLACPDPPWEIRQQVQIG